jgi:hypothetical protein
MRPPVHFLQRHRVGLDSGIAIVMLQTELIQQIFVRRAINAKFLPLLFSVTDRSQIEIQNKPLSSQVVLSK